MERLREIAAGRNLELAEPPPKKPPSSAAPLNQFMDEDGGGTKVEMCDHREFDDQTGEFIHCGLPKHGPKVSHGNEWRESA